MLFTPHLSALCIFGVSPVWVNVTLDCSPPQIPAESYFARDIGWGRLLELLLPTGVVEEAWAQAELLQHLWLPSLRMQEGWPWLWVDSKPWLVSYLSSILLENLGNDWGRVRRRAKGSCTVSSNSEPTQQNPCLRDKSSETLLLRGQAGSALSCSF